MTSSLLEGASEWVGEAEWPERDDGRGVRRRGRYPELFCTRSGIEASELTMSRCAG